MRIEVLELAQLPSLEDVGTLDECLLSGDFLLHETDILLDRLDLVAKVGDEAHAVVELDEQCLVVQDIPGAAEAKHVLTLEAAVGLALRALDGADLRIVEHLDLPHLLILESELVGLCDDLHLVGHLMCAHFLLVEEIDFLSAAGQVEEPRASDIFVTVIANHRLVSCDHDQ